LQSGTILKAVLSTCAARTKSKWASSLEGQLKKQWAK